MKPMYSKYGKPMAGAVSHSCIANKSFCSSVFLHVDHNMRIFRCMANAFFVNEPKWGHRHWPNIFSGRSLSHARQFAAVSFCARRRLFKHFKWVICVGLAHWTMNFWLLSVQWPACVTCFWLRARRRVLVFVAVSSGCAIFIHLYILRLESGLVE